ncbi:hypothetical protein OS128_05245 [Corynebacterium sp. P5848]|uniref:hypothetical protein n=1 Tax=Corynebacterium marambiense TaxID=2765364 RepID=UPI0022609604|nr:hypothetical protein [Corynebacterium marambiense]MCX7542316.1 hypothetical protein [Corynebacterium marambiense]
MTEPQKQIDRDFEAGCRALIVAKMEPLLGAMTAIAAFADPKNSDYSTVRLHLPRTEHEVMEMTAATVDQCASVAVAPSFSRFSDAWDEDLPVEIAAADAKEIGRVFKNAGSKDGPNPLLAIRIYDEKLVFTEDSTLPIAVRETSVPRPDPVQETNVRRAIAKAMSTTSDGLVIAEVKQDAKIKSAATTLGERTYRRAVERPESQISRVLTTVGPLRSLHFVSSGSDKPGETLDLDEDRGPALHVVTASPGGAV